jgi:hypothetical protein
MKLQLKSISDRGDSHKERLVIRVIDDTDIGEFIAMRILYNGASVTTAVTDTFWFPDKSVKAGDLLVIYSRDGQSKEKKLEGGRTAHFFYWGLEAPVWSESTRGVVLAHAPDWEASMAENLSPSAD